MALIKLKEYKLNGGGWPNNAAISFRFVSTPIGPNLASSPVASWNACPGSSQLNFSISGYLILFVNGSIAGIASGFVTPTPKTNVQANINTGYGVAQVKYDVL
ncbi:MAG: hypothetical protein AAF821_01270 [Cyanobacteria bacterium P01_D01_bin.156]